MPEFLLGVLIGYGIGWIAHNMLDPERIAPSSMGPEGSDDILSSESDDDSEGSFGPDYSSESYW